ncbi:hypothetical protein LCD46_14825 [Enterobacter ludwigii]|uniref:hypothetical protein n=1 Tax=Enterobacter TaxID=547 RepID=UPI00128E239F|nr:hypothetical protein [Enterobacter cloacae]MBO4147414.1 hypothetical protein [Enterobacter ludwigii]UOY69348.1 hypothetical protein LCD46_14825 [Enterobacter ludwigii]
MKKYFYLLALVSIVTGCTSGNVPKATIYSDSSPSSVCAALGIMKASNNKEDFNKTRTVIKRRIKEGNFNIKATECEEIALNSISAFKLISVDSVLI